MANEAQVSGRLTIRKGNLNVNRSVFHQVTIDSSSPRGPVPGAVSVETAGTDVSFAQLGTPGLCLLTNLDPTNYVSVGIYEPETARFYPMLELGPGETYVYKFSRDLLEDWTSTGTTPATNTFRLKANAAACIVVVEAYER